MIHSELLRQQNHYGAIRKRLWGKPQKPKAANENIPVVIEPPKPKPSWRLAASFFDAHVNAYRAHKFNKYTSFIKQRCDDIGIQYEVFLNTSRRRKGSMDLSMKRHQIRWETKKKFPELTLLQMSRICGNLDHSSLLWSFKRMDELVAKGYKLLGEENAAV